MSRIEWQPAGSEAEDFVITADPDRGSSRPITGALWLPDHHDATTPLILCGHGASGDRYQAPIPHLAKRLLRECGYATLSLDGPVHGLRQVGPGGREALAEEMRRPEFVDDMVSDWLSALSVMASEKNIGHGPLGYFGLSMGTIFGLPLLAAAAAAGVKFNAATLGLAGTTGAVSFISQRLLEDARAITLPVAFLMQLEDELFPRDGYLELFDALACSDKRLHANPGLHPEIPAEEIAFSFEFLSARMAAEIPRNITNPIAD
jgi:alpha-beta hydrolase superfamily lysophospholipase